VEKPLRIGVVGLGFGQHHVRTLANMTQAELVGVADSNPDVPGGLEGYAAKYGAKAYRDGVEMIREEGLDAVSLCTSPRWRAPLIEAAAEAGAALIIEKPWAGNLQQARELAELCERCKAPVMTAFSFRFHPAVARLRELMDGPLGEGRVLNGSYMFPWIPAAGHWLWDPDNGGGFFNENSCHLLDVICHLLGDPVELTAEAINPTGAPSETAAALSIRFASGAVAAVTVGGLAAGAFCDYPRIDLTTADGQAHLVGRTHIWEELRWATNDSDAMRSVVQPPEALGSTRYTHAFEHFFECIRRGEQPSASVRDGVRSVAMAMAIYESARTGRKAKVELEPDAPKAKEARP
jgi:myo-inositol 2-dehydrogenase / D-chiro-inositol 1-dehydrogenase